MHRSRLRTPSPSLVISTIALIVAMGGTSYAALSLPPNSVGTRQLRNFAVTKKKIANGAVTRAKINFRSLGTVPSADNANNATNANHANSANAANTATNATTAASANSLNGVTYVRTGPDTASPATTTGDTAICPAGTGVIAGGLIGNGNPQSIGSSWPTRQSNSSPQPDAWAADVHNSGTTSSQFWVYAICAPLHVTSSFSGSFAPRTP